MYFGKNGERYAEDIFALLSIDEQEAFEGRGYVIVDNDVMAGINNIANTEQKDIIADENGYPILQERIKSDKDILKSELNGLQAYLNSSDYVSIHYGEILTQENKTIFLDKVSSTFNMSNMNILIKREEARDRIDELRILIEE